MKKFPGTSKLLLLAAAGIVAALAIRALAEDQPGKEGPDRRISDLSEELLRRRSKSSGRI